MKSTAILLLTWSLCHAQEITPDHITAAVCQVETGCVWIGPGVVSGRHPDGGYGETGPWQATPETLADMGRSVSRNRLSVPYAEATFRTWYSRLLSKHGTPEQALAAYHRGSRGRHKASAKDYAARVLNLAQRLAKEQAQ